MLGSLFLVNVALAMAIILIFFVFTQAIIWAWQGRQLDLEQSQRPWGWWIEVHTQSPDCLYYFGPFTDQSEAEASVQGYVQDLSEEGAKHIVAQIKFCKPAQLTIPTSQPSELHLSCL